jgi:hypothetical protein
VYLLVGGIAAMVVLVVLAAVLGTLVLGMGADAGGAATPADAAAGDGSGSAATATGTPARNLRHSTSETFRVGGGEQTIEYTVTGVRTASAVGGSYGAEADGIFVPVEIRMVNVGRESLDVTSRPYRIVDGQGREHETDSDAVIHAEDAVNFEQLDPGLSKRGVLVFDVPADQESRTLKIEPAGMFSTADDRFVELS